MSSKELLYQGELLLEKMQGKGGWTYAIIPNFKVNNKTAFGWCNVLVNIDNGTWEGECKLASAKEKGMFLPFNAKLRKVTKKSEGDTISISIYALTKEAEQEIFDCLTLHPLAEKSFLNLSAKEKNKWINWISNSNNSTQKETRILKLIHLLS